MNCRPLFWKRVLAAQAIAIIALAAPMPAEEVLGGALVEHLQEIQAKNAELGDFEAVYSTTNSSTKGGLNGAPHESKGSLVVARKGDSIAIRVGSDLGTDGPVVYSETHIYEGNAQAMIFAGATLRMAAQEVPCHLYPPLNTDLGYGIAGAGKEVRMQSPAEVAASRLEKGVMFMRTPGEKGVEVSSSLVPVAFDDRELSFTYREYFDPANGLFLSSEWGIAVRLAGQPEVFAPITTVTVESRQSGITERVVRRDYGYGNVRRVAEAAKSRDELISGFAAAHATPVDMQTATLRCINALSPDTRVTVADHRDYIQTINYSMDPNAPGTPVFGKGDGCDLGPRLLDYDVAKREWIPVVASAK